MKKLFLLCAILIAASGSAFASLPAGWVSNDVGNVGGTGTASESSGTFTISDRGSQVYSIADSGQFAYRHGEPDASSFTISARVATMSATDPYAQACVMIRETLLPGAKMFAICTNKLNGMTVIARQHRDEAASVTQLGSRAYPVYLRVTRADLNFTAEYSTDGSTWVQVGATTRVTMVGWCLYGLMTSSHDTGTLRAATFTNVTYTFAAVASYFYASPSATSGTGTWTDPYSIDQVLKTATIAAGSRILLRGGLYKIGSITTPLAGSSTSARTTIRALPGERAIIDGDRFATLTSATGNQACGQIVSATFDSVASIYPGETTVSINGEQMSVNSVVGSTVNMIRCWNATTRYRPANGIHPAGSIVKWTRGTIYTTGAFLDWWDVEFTKNEVNRGVVAYDDDSDNRSSQARGGSLTISGPNQRVINLIAHDAGEGVTSTEAATSLSLYGSLFYNGGTLGYSRGNGHGIYLQNAGTIPITVSKCIAGNQAAVNFKAGSETGGANRVYYDKLIAFASASMYRRGSNTGFGIANLEILTSVNPITYGEMTNCVAWNPNDIGGTGITIGYQAPYNEDFKLSGNYVIGGMPGIRVTNFRSITAQDNFLYVTNGNPNATQAVVQFSNSTYGWTAAGLFMTGSVGVKNSGDRVPTCIGKGWTGCGNQVRDGNGTLYTVASVSEDGNTVTFSGTPPPVGNVTIYLPAGVTIQTHPNVPTFVFNRNTYQNDILATGGSSTRATYAYQYAEPGITVSNALGGGSLRPRPDGGKAWEDWSHADTGTGGDATAFNVGKPTGVLRGVNLLTEFDSGDGRVAHVWLVNWQDAASVTIPASAITSPQTLLPGDQYEVRKAENYFGAPVASGTFDGTDITVPTTDKTVAERVGDDFVSPSTQPRFLSLLIVRK